MTAHPCCAFLYLTSFHYYDVSNSTDRYTISCVVITSQAFPSPEVEAFFLSVPVRVISDEFTNLGTLYKERGAGGVPRVLKAKSQRYKKLDEDAIISLVWLRVFSTFVDKTNFSFCLSSFSLEREWLRLPSGTTNHRWVVTDSIDKRLSRDFAIPLLHKLGEY